MCRNIIINLKVSVKMPYIQKKTASPKSETVFVKIISTLNYDAEFISGAGIAKNATWSNTNRYLTGKAKSPNGITVIGGKTGTTFQSGYCLVLLSENEKKERIISIVYKADSSWNLYLLMNQILVFAN